ncbi:MAG: monovalent cation/H+ antiporter complex subunit F [Eubacterium sp.]|nr:monovalent cation/H+ antiporter complex subunit F [Eubacterium sp.]
MIYHYVYLTFLIILALMLFPCLIRAIRGPRIADRLMSVNMMGTLVMVMIAILALMLHEGYLVDVCLVYAMISFLAVVVLTKVYIGVYEEKRRTLGQEEEEGGMSDGHL